METATRKPTIAAINAGKTIALANKETLVTAGHIIMPLAKEKGVTITHVFDTHLHADHISGGRVIAEKTKATYWLPPKDAEKVV